MLNDFQLRASVSKLNSLGFLDCEYVWSKKRYVNSQEVFFKFRFDGIFFYFGICIDVNENFNFEEMILSEANFCIINYNDRNPKNNALNRLISLQTISKICFEAKDWLVYEPGEDNNFISDCLAKYSTFYEFMNDFSYIDIDIMRRDLNTDISF